MNKKSRLLELQLEKEKQILQQKNDQLQYKYGIIQQKNRELNNLVQNIFQNIREISDSQNFKIFKKQIYNQQFISSSLSVDIMFQLGKQIIDITNNYSSILEQLPQTSFLFKSQNNNAFESQIDKQMQHILQENQQLKQQLKESTLQQNTDKQVKSFLIQKNFEFQQKKIEEKKNQSEIEIQYSINSLEENVKSNTNNSTLKSSQKDSVLDEDFSTPQFEIYKTNEQYNQILNFQKGCSKNLQDELDQFLDQGKNKLQLESNFKSPQKYNKKKTNTSEEMQNLSQDKFKELKELQNINILCSIDQNQNEHFDKIKQVYENDPDLFCEFFKLQENDKQLLLQAFYKDDKNLQINTQQNNFIKKQNLISFQNIDNSISNTLHNNAQPNIQFVNSCENFDNIDNQVNQVESIYANQENLQQKETSLNKNCKIDFDYNKQNLDDFEICNNQDQINNSNIVKDLQKQHNDIFENDEETIQEKLIKNPQNEIDSNNYYTLQQNKRCSIINQNDEGEKDQYLFKSSFENNQEKQNINLSQRYSSNNADSFSQKLSIQKSDERIEKKLNKKKSKNSENQKLLNNINKKKQQQKLKVDFSPSITKKLQTRVNKIVTNKQKTFQNKLNDKNNQNQNRLFIPFSYNQKTKQKKNKVINQKKSFKNLSNFVKKTKGMTKSKSFVDKKIHHRKINNVSSSSDEEMQIVTKEIIQIEDIVRDDRSLKLSSNSYNQKKFKKSFKDFEKCFAKVCTKSILKKFYQIIFYQSMQLKLQCLLVLKIFIFYRLIIKLKNM